MHRILCAAALILASLATNARAQMPFSLGIAGSTSPVLSSKDFQGILEAIGMDETQREVASSSFDDAQARMFAAKRAADSVRTRAAGAEDDQHLAEQEQARRAMAQAILGEVDGLFQSMSAVATAAQREALERERLAAKRRCIRAMLGPAGSEGAAQFDMERAVAMSRIPADQAEQAYRQLAPYRQRLASLFQRLLDEAIAQPRRALRARAGSARTAGDASSEGAEAGQAAFLDGLRQWSESMRNTREICVQMATAHRDGLASLEGAIPADGLAKVRTTALARIWPRSAIDPDSPERVIGQLIAKAAGEESRAAIESVRSAWQPRWWAATLRMTVAEDAMRGSGPMMMLMPPNGEQDPDAAKARADLREARTERRTVDRDAWRMLAGVDPARRAFHEGMAARDPGKDQFSGPASLPAEEGAGAPQVPDEGAAVAGSVATIIIGRSGGDGETDTMVFQSDEIVGAEGMMLTIGEGGEAVAFGDAFGDGMGSNIAFSGISIAEGREAGQLRVVLPGPIDPAGAARIARALGADPSSPAIASLLDDYVQKARDLDERAGAPLRADGSGRPGLPAGRAKEAPALVDAYVDGLATLDDELVAGIGAVAGAPEPAVRAAKDERAVARDRATRYATGLMGGATPSAITAVGIGGCIGEAGLDAADRSRAVDAWVAWVPSARAAAARWRAHDRTHVAEMIELELRQFRRMQDLPAPDVDGGPVQVTAQVDAEAQARLGELMQSLSEVLAAMDAATVAGQRSVDAVLSEDGKARFRSAWFRAAAPRVYADSRDAMPSLDAAFTMPGLTDAQRSQVNALRGEHAALHRDVCDRLAELSIAATSGKVDAPGPDGRARLEERNRAIADGRFERTELNARSLRRLRSILTAEQARAIPALGLPAPKAAVSRAPTPEAPVPQSP